MIYLILTCTALILLNQRISEASSGDIARKYVNCKHSCINENCMMLDKPIIKLPDNLRAYTPFSPIWTCPEICYYDCMMNITALDIENKAPVKKYHGHWPFIRFFGLEQPASVLFSLANTIPHIIHIFSRNENKRVYYFMTSWLSLVPFISLNAWLCSAYFHSKITPFSSLIDYVSALLLISYSLWLALRRIMGAYVNSKLVITLFVLYSALILNRIRLMIQNKISFNSHMTLAILLSCTHIIIWMLWIIYQCYRKDNNYDKLTRKRTYIIIFCQVWFIAASMFELFDFPPFFGIFDAHSLWHFATPLLGSLWYYFWRLDAFIESTPKESKCMT